MVPAELGIISRPFYLNMIGEKQKKKIETEVGILQEQLNLQLWKISVEFLNQNDPQDEKMYAEMVANAPYLEAKIRIYPYFFKNKEWEIQREMLIHEMCHVVLAPFKFIAENRFTNRDEFSDVNEKITTHIERIILKHVKISK